MKTGGKNGQKLEMRNEKPVNGKKRKAGNGPSHNKDVKEKSYIKVERGICQRNTL